MQEFYKIFNKMILFLLDPARLMSLVAIIISILTLCEIKKERRLSYKPKIVPDQPDFFLQSPKEYLGAIWKIESDDIYLKKMNPNINIADMAFSNVGLGPAIDVEFVWQFDQNQVTKQLYNLCDLMPDHLDSDPKKNTITTRRRKTSSKFTEYTQVFSLVDAQDIYPNTKHYILPIAQNTSGKTFIRIPSLYVLYLSVLSLLILFDKKETYRAQVPLGLTIISRDSGGSRIEDSYTFDFTLNNTTGLVSYDEQEFSISQNYGLCSISIRKK